MRRDSFRGFHPSYVHFVDLCRISLVGVLKPPIDVFLVFRSIPYFDVLLRPRRSFSMRPKKNEVLITFPPFAIVELLQKVTKPKTERTHRIMNEYLSEIYELYCVNKTDELNIKKYCRVDKYLISAESDSRVEL